MTALSEFENHPVDDAERRSQPGHHRDADAELDAQQSRHRMRMPAFAAPTIELPAQVAKALPPPTGQLPVVEAHPAPVPTGQQPVVAPRKKDEPTGEIDHLLRPLLSN
jgi:hypothetical protein